MTERDHKRAALLQAANAIILEQGTDAMTLEAVAQRAGVSKGGLLYHFPNKESLIQAMVSNLIAEFDAAIAEEMRGEIAAGQSPAAGRWLRAYVRMNTAPASEDDAVAAALVAALGGGLGRLTPVLEATRRWQERAEQDGIVADVATAIRLAADGCWMSALFGVTTGIETPKQLSAVRRVLLRWVDQAIAESNPPKRKRSVKP